MTVSSQVRTLYLSDDAYNELAMQAHTRGYVASPDTPRGLSIYIEWILSNHTFTDTRPEDIKAQDSTLRAANYTPEWQLYYPRRRHKLAVSNNALLAASIECLSLGIAVYPSRPLTGAPNYLDSIQCAAALLEALGTGWVTPQRKVNQ